MFRRKTLFVLGAGSSAEVDMPVGESLKGLISEKLNIEYDQLGNNLVSGDRGVARALLRFAESGEGGYSNAKVLQQIQKAHSLRKALPHAISIDNLLDAHRGDKVVEICGKLGIFQSILEAEKRSKLFVSGNEPVKFDNLTKTWFAEFVKILTEEVPKSEIGTIFNNVSFVNFNYDRCLEHYLANAISNYYGIEDKTVIETMKSLKVLRPYGSVGLLPWQNNDNDSNFSLAFGADTFLSDNDLYKLDKGVQLLNRAKQIKTFNEKQHEQQALNELHTAVREAQNIVFLGFAFHRQNLELLNPGAKCMARSVFATNLGISDDDTRIIQHDLFKLLAQKNGVGPKFHFLERNCGSLFKEYRRSLTS